MSSEDWRALFYLFNPIESEQTSEGLPARATPTALWSPLHFMIQSLVPWFKNIHFRTGLLPKRFEVTAPSSLLSGLAGRLVFAFPSAQRRFGPHHYSSAFLAELRGLISSISPEDTMNGHTVPVAVLSSLRAPRSDLCLEALTQALLAEWPSTLLRFDLACLDDQNVH